MECDAASNRTLIERVHSLVGDIEHRIVGYRRDFHRYAESGWTEFRTASLIARRLQDLGYEVRVGRDVVAEEDRMGVPDPNVLELCWQRAVREGGDKPYMQAMRSGYTGVVGILSNRAGPTVGLRFDMDALDIDESVSTDHRPVREGFASVHQGVAHACGHDGHAAVGLGVAEVLTRLRERVDGTVKLIFQPAEEGVRGAKSMVGAGVLDDVDYFLGHHVYGSWELGEISCGAGGYLATTKFDASLTGLAVHAAGEPHKGKNALLAAATAVLNLYAISRHRDGSTRVNVGRLVAGTGRNVIPATAHLAVETRGATTELNEYMYERAVRVLASAAAMYDCELKIRAMGRAQSANSDPDLAARVEEVALAIGGFKVRPPEPVGGSEDITYMMERVQANGGLATNIGVGASLGGWGHHTAEFDFDERVLACATKLLSVLAVELAYSRE
jgi:aminobenzoyl-glutamate utilization protein A